VRGAGKKKKSNNNNFCAKWTPHVVEVLEIGSCKSSYSRWKKVIKKRWKTIYVFGS
jgi:hypothetical protein